MTEREQHGTDTSTGSHGRNTSSVNALLERKFRQGFNPLLWHKTSLDSASPGCYPRLPVRFFCFSAILHSWPQWLCFSGLVSGFRACFQFSIFGAVFLLEYAPILQL
jgi:hypothetical protein